MQGTETTRYEMTDSGKTQLSAEWKDDGRRSQSHSLILLLIWQKRPYAYAYAYAYAYGPADADALGQFHMRKR